MSGSCNLRNIRWVLVVVCAAAALFLFLSASPAVALAQDLDAVGESAGFDTDTDLTTIIGRIIGVFLSVLGVIALVIIIYAGFLWMTAGGNPDQVDKAKKWMINGVIGLIIILSAYAIATFIMNALTGDGLFGDGDSGSTSSTPTLESGSNSLGSGGIEDHYPERYATDIARNSKIMVTFVSTMNIESFVSGYDTNGTPDDTSDDTTSTALNTDNILIYKTAEGVEAALTEDEVEVQFTDDLETFVFKTEEYMGSSTEDTNYTVYIGDEVEDVDGETDLVDSGGYWWTFTVGTEIDLTPPYVKSISPSDGAEKDRNIAVQVTFSEAVDPTSATGDYDSSATSGNFENIQIEASSSGLVSGTYAISNGYKTVTFTSSDACGTNSCGQTIYCLPGNETQSVTVFGATPGDDPPQVEDFPYDGIVDAASNALDGDEDGDVEATGEEFAWSFDTTNDINLDAPEISSIAPNVAAEEVSLDEEVVITFDSVMMSSTITSENIYLENTPDHELWFSFLSTDLDSTGAEVTSTAQEVAATEVEVRHGALYETTDETTYYYSANVDDGVLNEYQNCYVPGTGPDGSGGTCGVSSSQPYCCQGVASSSACSFF